MESTIAPILSTPAEHLFAETAPIASTLSEDVLSEGQLYIQYEIQRTLAEIRDGRYKRIALQFPDEMLRDAPRVFDRLRQGLKQGRLPRRSTKDFVEGVETLKLSDPKLPDNDVAGEDANERLCILGDTSYGSCCVDEIAAEHVDAEVVVHYGRACLSPTARLPVIYVFTSKPLDLDSAVASFKATYEDKMERVCLMADIPYHHHIPPIHQALKREGYENVFATEVIRNPSSLLPNRTVPPEVQEHAELLKEYSVFHMSNPPTSLLLILSSRIRKMHIFPTDTTAPTALESSTAALLRRRYALLTGLTSAPIIGILINTLSVRNYMSALAHCETLVRAAGKKSHVFVVGKINTAKLANFSEIGAWVVIGCWESSLVENLELNVPVVTPFELEVGLRKDADRTWGGEWIGDFAEVLGRKQFDEGEAIDGAEVNASLEDHSSDDEPPDFDLRTGKYVSRTRPMGRPKVQPNPAELTLRNDGPATEGPPSSALVQRAKAEVATINGAVSPAAEFLRSKRTWVGLGSDYEIAYERDEEGKIRGAAMEEGRSGVARGYAVGQDPSTS